LGARRAAASSQSLLGYTWYLSGRCMASHEYIDISTSVNLYIYISIYLYTYISIYL
jgi:hypothetical protein